MIINCKEIMNILEIQGVNLEGKNVVIAQCSNIDVKSLVNLMIDEGATVTLCNNKTNKDCLSFLFFNADIFISAIDKANYFNKKFFLDNRMLTEYLDNTIALNLCINRDNDDKLYGGIDKELYNSFKDVIDVTIIDLGF